MRTPIFVVPFLVVLGSAEIASTFDTALEDCVRLDADGCKRRLLSEVDNDFVRGHFYLGLLEQQRPDLEAALRHYE